ncbi:MAG TPA: DUF192 domain-containing protein [Candidatus Omnitrophica bacterium]|nr:MAG: hypothetical protein DRP61_03220 [Candidatus Omnitrophota bacterium]RKY34436.1 MAG: hypothetical protein DRP69_04665 [Candidatus Omnitrophota bacterium]RKY44066.1 MAG: hypothetical protein DRP80_03405 [Candidatus Omnitrophota bacterium]HEC68897.1 DUF192 domain-containing protein [Candidatus Omnitrophota bacterium]
MVYRIINKTKDSVLASQAKIADNFFKRFLGLMFRKSLSKEEALIFFRAPSIHTFFMRFALDILFLDKEGKVLRIARKIKPWRMVFCRNSSVTVEFSSENNNLAKTSPGDFIIIENVVK